MLLALEDIAQFHFCHYENNTKQNMLHNHCDYIANHIAKQKCNNLKRETKV